jgi:nitroimidazol reductase NimA-like FMN-containing flavoprotein (pyridoxamine 5'-phosphate oxidase superfamily)
MPEYGVDTPDWQALPWEWAAERLVANRNYWVVTVSGAGRPHALPVWGVWDDDEHRFAFSCGPSSRKARNITANAAVVITNSDTVECVSVEGVAAVVPDDDERRERWIARYVEKYEPRSEAMAEFVRGHLVIEVEPDRAFGIVEREDEFSTRATRWRF